MRDWFRRHRLFRTAVYLIVLYALCWGVSAVIAYQSQKAYDYAWYVHDEAASAASGVEEMVKARGVASPSDQRALQWKLPDRLPIDRSHKPVSYSPFVWVLWQGAWQARHDVDIIEEDTVRNMTYVVQVSSDYTPIP